MHLFSVSFLRVKMYFFQKLEEARLRLYLSLELIPYVLTGFIKLVSNNSVALLATDR